jgi:transcriptional regulator with XRE-family HTH domain
MISASKFLIIQKFRQYEALEEEFKLLRQIISLRKASGLSQREFAMLLGMKQPQLARIESGKQSPKLETIVKLAAGDDYKVELHFVAPKNQKKLKIDP